MYLYCGVRLILKPETDSNMLAMVVIIRLPQPVTAQERATSEIVSQSLFNSSEVRTSAEIKGEIAKVGGSIDVLRTPEYISISCFTTPGQFETAEHLLTGVLKNATFTSNGIALAKKNVLNLRKSSSDTLESKLKLLTQGTADEPELDLNLLASVTPELASRYYRSVFTPLRTTISIAGRFDSDTAIKSIGDLLDDFTRPSDASVSAKGVLKLGGMEGKMISSRTVSNIDRVFLATTAPGVSNPDYAAFTVLQCALGSGHGSRLVRKIRDGMGVAYQVGVSYRPDIGGPMIAYLEWDSSRVAGAGQKIVRPAQALKLLEREIDGLISEPLTLQELERAKGLSIGLDLQRHERLRERAFMPAWYEAMGVGCDFDRLFPSKLRAVTNDEVMRASKIYLPHRTAFLF